MFCSMEKIMKLEVIKDFENIIFSYANIADCKIAEKLAEVVKGQYLRMQGIYRKKMF